MDCPVCHEPLLVLDHDGVEVDFCYECQGIWLDRGELELLLGGTDRSLSFLRSGSPLARTKEKRRRCPICDAKMDKAGLGDVVYDRCPRGDGLWLDQGELERLMRLGHAEDRVPEFLASVFGKEKGR